MKCASFATGVSSIHMAAARRCSILAHCSWMTSLMCIASGESFAGMPDVGAAQGVKDDIHSVAREALNFCHEVLMLVINRDTAQVGNGQRRACTS